VDWANLKNGASIATQNTIIADPHIIFDEKDIEPFASEVFAKF